jgi:hypothetical protein
VHFDHEVILRGWGPAHLERECLGGRSRSPSRMTSKKDKGRNKSKGLSGRLDG